MEEVFVTIIEKQFILSEYLRLYFLTTIWSKYYKRNLPILYKIYFWPFKVLQTKSSTNLMTWINIKCLKIWLYHSELVYQIQAAY